MAEPQALSYNQIKDLVKLESMEAANAELRRQLEASNSELGIAQVAVATAEAKAERAFSEITAAASAAAHQIEESAHALRQANATAEAANYACATLENELREMRARVAMMEAPAPLRPKSTLEAHEPGVDPDPPPPISIRYIPEYDGAGVLRLITATEQ